MYSSGLVIVLGRTDSIRLGLYFSGRLSYSGDRFWLFLSFRHVKRKRMVKNLAGDRVNAAATVFGEITF